MLKKIKTKKYMIYIIVIASVLFSFINLYVYANTPRRIYILGVSNNTESKKEYWIDFLDKNPAYLSGWIQLALIEHYLGNTSSSIKALNEAKKIDPNSSIISDVESKIAN